jgi:vitamin K-dependent gamma-carboxylase-like protein
VNPRALIDAWNSFWFKPTSTSSLAVFRIGFGLVVLAWSISLVPDATSLFSKDGILPDQPHYTGLVGGAWGLLGIFPSKAAMIVLLVALIVASLSLMLGVFSQAAALVVFLGVLSFERRDPFVFNSGDVLIRLLALYLIFAPASAALSLERFIRDRESFWTFPQRAPWAMRLIQIQFSVVYLIAVWTKVRGTTWNVGTAVSFALRITDLNRFPVPAFVQNSALISNFFTFGTLALELSLAILVWNRKLRPWVLLAGLSLHLGIEYSIRVGFYGFAIMSMYLIWVPPERMDDLLLSLRRRLSRRAGGSPELASS